MLRTLTPQIFQMESLGFFVYSQLNTEFIDDLGCIDAPV